MSEQEAIAIIENEKTCVRRKIDINCSNCDTCDLVMKDTDILSALDMAQAALRAQQEHENPKPKYFIETSLPPKIKVGDTVFWVHCSNRVYEGKVEQCSICDYQGAIYLELYSPKFKLNPFPNVHYSHCFLKQEDAREFASTLKREGKNAMRCDRCRYEFSKRPVHEPKGKQHE